MCCQCRARGQVMPLMAFIVSLALIALASSLPILWHSHSLKHQPLHLHAGQYQALLRNCIAYSTQESWDSLRGGQSIPRTGLPESLANDYYTSAQQSLSGLPAKERYLNLTATPSWDYSLGRLLSSKGEKAYFKGSLTLSPPDVDVEVEVAYRADLILVDASYDSTTGILKVWVRLIHNATGGGSYELWPTAELTAYVRGPGGRGEPSYTVEPGTDGFYEVTVDVGTEPKQVLIRSVDELGVVLWFRLDPASWG